MPDHKLTILLIEDDIVDRMAFERFVSSSRLPYEIVVAATVAEATRRMAERPFDIIVSDYMLTDGTAFDILQSGTTAPVIITTGSGDEETAVQAMKAGAYDYLVKDPDLNYLNILPVTVDKAIGQRESERLYRLLTHAMMSVNDAVFITDTSGRITFVNAAFSTMYGYGREEVVGRHVRLLSDLEPAFAVQNGAALISSRSGAPDETTHLRKDGTAFAVSLTRSTVVNEDGQLSAIVGVARDISERKATEERLIASLEEKDVLLKEIHHRVKNNLQVISSILSLQSGFITDPATVEVLRESQNRVKSMALIHERLYRSGAALTRIDFGDYAANLLSHLKQSYARGREIAVKIDVTAPELELDQAIPLGLLVNELVSNAFKHAFPESLPSDEAASPRVDVRLSSRTAAMADRSCADGETKDPGELLCLTVSDNGQGLPPELTSCDLTSCPSLGIQLVASLVAQLQGTLGVAGPPGTTFTISFPLH